VFGVEVSGGFWWGGWWGFFAWGVFWLGGFGVFFGACFWVVGVWCGLFWGVVGGGFVGGVFVFFGVGVCVWRVCVWFFFFRRAQRQRPDSSGSLPRLAVIPPGTHDPQMFLFSLNYRAIVRFPVRRMANHRLSPGLFPNSVFSSVRPFVDAMQFPPEYCKEQPSFQHVHYGIDRQTGRLL